MDCPRIPKKRTVSKKGDEVNKEPESVNTNQPVYNCRNNVLNQRNCSNLFHEWKFGTLNVRSGKEKLEGARIYAITKEVERANLSFCCLQEVRHRKTGKKLITLDTTSTAFCGVVKRREEMQVSVF